MPIKKTAELQFNSNAKDVANDVNKVDEKLISVKAQLKNANVELINAQKAFGDYSKEALAAAQKVAGLKDQIQEAAETAALFDPGAKFQAFSGSLQAVAGGFSVVQGAMGAFGAESENVEELLLRVNSAMALSQGLSAVADSAKDFKRLGAMITSNSVAQAGYAKATVLAGAAQKLFAGSVETTSVGFKVLRGAIISTGIGALVVGIGMLIANFDKVKEVVLNLVPGLSAVGDIVMGIVNAVTDFVGVTSDATRAVDKMKADAEKSLAKNKKFLQEHGDEIDEFTKRKIDAVDRYHEALLEDGANEVKLRQRLNRELKKADDDRAAERDKKRKDEADKDAAAAKKIQDEKKAAAAREAAEQKAYDDDYLNAEKTLQQQIEDLEDKTAQARLDRQAKRELEDINELKGKSDAELQILRDAHAKKFALLNANLKEEENKKNQASIDATSKEIQAEIDKNTVKKELRDAQSKEELDALFAKLKEELDARQEATLKEFEYKQASDLAEYERINGRDEGYYALQEEQGAALTALKTSQSNEDVALESQASEAKINLVNKEKEVKLAQYAAIGNALNSLTAIAGENTAAGKALGIASATINTFIGISEVWAAKSMGNPVLDMAVKIASTAAVAASGFANVKKIMSVKVPKAKGGGGGGAAMSAPAKPSVNFQNTPQTQISDSIQQSAQVRNSNPQRVYVTQDDLTEAQAERDRRLNQNRF